MRITAINLRSAAGPYWRYSPLNPMLSATRKLAIPHRSISSPDFGSVAVWGEGLLGHARQRGATPGAMTIQGWKIRYVKRAGENPARQRSSRISCNSALRQARALFSRQILGFIDPDLVPSPLPFSSVKFYPRESMKYQSKIDMAALLQSAKEDLFESDPEAFKTFLLGLGAGLRRGEIDRLLWRQIDFNAGTICIEVTEVSALKSETSAGTVPIDAAMITLLRGFKPKARGQYVIEGGVGVTASKPWGLRYRCQDVFSRLIQWLRTRGVAGVAPLHMLRKEAGSAVVTAGGIFAGRRFLRHADISVTAQFYVDQKQRVVVDMSGLLQNVTALPAPMEREAS